MGCCQAQQQSIMENIEYSKGQNIKVACRDTFGRITTRSKVYLELKPPVQLFFRHLSAGSKLVRVSGCVLPGFDPIKARKSDCQDNYGIFEYQDTILIVLFDGHGSNGHHVASFCKDFMEQYFKTSQPSFESSPKPSIEAMVLQCDAELKASKLDTSLSGTTAVIAYINAQGIHVGSVGDSRAVLSTVPKSIIDPSMEVPKSQNKFSRPVTVARKLQPIALTVDQKPNHSAELKRIQNAGGEVRRIADDLGNPIGPYRVWLKDVASPGLGMSRAIGDKVASSIGVIPNPILNSFKTFPELDQFIVIASDGIWDVMENIEVVNFVEKFRGKVASKESTQDYPARLDNSTIARLLCEEARYRWLGILENEDVCVDDISCVIVELTEVDPTVVWKENSVEERHHETVFTSVAVEGVVNLTKNKAARNDPTRGSMADDDTPYLAEALK